MRRERFKNTHVSDARRGAPGSTQEILDMYF